MEKKVNEEIEFQDTQIQKLTQNIVHDLYDSKKFSETLYKSELKNNISAHVGEYNKYPELTQDLFYSMFKYNPDFEEQSNVKEDYQLNRKLTEKVMETESYKQLRSYTKLNEASSGIASATLAEQIMKENKDLFDKIDNDEQKKQENRKSLKELFEEFKKLEKSNAPQDQMTKQQILNKMNNIMQQQNQLKQNQQQTAEQVTIVNACNNTAKSIKAQEEIFEMGFSRGLGAGTPSKVSVTERLKFAKQYANNKNFQKLINLFGKMKRLAEKKQKEKSKQCIDTIESVYQSGDINHLCSSELGNLCVDELNVLFYKKFIEKQLLTYELIGTESKGKGAIISCLDISGSMSGEKDQLAKSIALALVAIAHHQKRDSYVILFDHGIEAVFPFPKETQNYWESLTEMAELFTGGGTSFTEPLQKAIEIFKTGKTEAIIKKRKGKTIETDEKDEKTNTNWLKADLVFITDGNGFLDENVKNEFLQLKKDKKISVYSIIIDASFNFVEHGLSSISDTLVSAVELDDKMAGELFEAI